MASSIPYLYKLANLAFKYISQNTNLLFKLCDFVQVS
jgi:hypothetical protein